MVGRRRGVNLLHYESLSDHSTLTNLSSLGCPRRVWAVAACRGSIERLIQIHISIAERFVAGDRLLYFGDYLGNRDSARIIDELLAFRRYLLSMPSMISSDFVYLRGVQEEIWSKLLQIQFAPNPSEVLKWMLERGAAETITAYGGSPDEGIIAAREGAIAITKWTNGLRDAMRHQAGHDKLMSVLRRAAFTEAKEDGQLLFVHAGLDPSRSLSEQGDSFWWSASDYSKLKSPFQGFKRIFRGADPAGGGRVLDGYAITLDAGNRESDPLLAVAIGSNGDIVEIIEA
jgi:serine/threonine protein phosphatase 1